MVLAVRLIGTKTLGTHRFRPEKSGFVREIPQ
jgi:hypothetical protein